MFSTYRFRFWPAMAGALALLILAAAPVWAHSPVEQDLPPAQLSDPALVAPINRITAAPVAADDVYTATEDIALVVPAPGVLGNDSDPDTDPLTATVDAAPLTGTLDLRGSGAFTYTAPLNWNGLITFTYIVSDGALTDAATVSILVTPVNDGGPLAADDSGTGFTTDEDTAFTTGDVLANDTDPDNDPLAVQSFDTSGTLGLVSLVENVGLDTGGFGAPNGYVLTDLGYNDEGFGVALQADGKIVMVGYADNGSNNDFAVVRYDNNGNLDTSFDGDGQVTTDFGSYDHGQSVAIQSDGKIIVAGSAHNGNNFDFAIVRYNLDGSLDAAFGAGGKVTTDLGSSDGGYGVAIQADGKVIVAGRAHNGSNYDFAIVRYNTDGNLDMSFDSDGYVTTDFGFDDRISSVALQSNGKIVVAGDIANNDDYEIAVARYNTDGSLDTSFGTGGKVTTYLGPDARGYSVIIQADDKIIVAGRAIKGSYDSDFAVVRYNANGSLDLSFGDDGKVTTDLSLDDRCYDIVLQSNGKIVVAGYTSNSGHTDFALVRYNTDGSLDTSFDGDGKVTTDLGYNENGNGVAIQSDGKIVVAGSAYDTSGVGNFAVARYNASGSTFTYDPNGQFDWLAAGETATDTFTYVVSDGLLTDTATVSITINGASEAPVALNDAYTTTEDTPLIVAAPGVLGNDTDADSSAITATLNSTPFTGTLDLRGSGAFTYTAPLNWNGLVTFSYIASDGALTDTATVSITVTPVNDGGPAAADDSGPDFTTDEATTFTVGNVLNNDTDPDDDPLFVQGFDASETLGLVSLGGGGSLDTSGFGAPNGYVFTSFGSDDYGYSVALQSNGKIVVAGEVDHSDTYDFAVARYNPDGSLDISFDGDGQVTTNFLGYDNYVSDVALQPDGKIVVVAVAYNDGSANFALVRYNPDGSLDTSFDGDGRLMTDFGYNDGGNGIAIQPDGKIVAAGFASNGSNSDFAVVRYNTDGSLDTTFDSDGKVTTDFGFGDYISGVALQPDGKIVVAGDASNGSNYDFAVARYNTDGSLDTSFDDDGKVTTDFGPSDDWGYNIAIQPDGKIVVVGNTHDANWVGDLAIARYNADGSLDTTFDGDGKITTDLKREDYGNDVALQSDGKIVVAGYVSDSSASDLAVVRYNPDGSLDSSFGSDGKVIADFGSYDRGNGIAIQADGKIVVAGYVYSDAGYNSNFAIIRYNASGSTFTYDPNGQFDWLVAGEVATDTFTYVVSDGFLTDTATVSITVNGASEAPVAANDTYTTTEDTPLVVPAPGVLSNDTDADSSILTATLNSAPFTGTLDLRGSGAFTYTAPLNWNGLITFSYAASDGALTDTATVSILVTPVNDGGPLAADDSGPGFTTDENTAFTTDDVLANDTDPDNDPLVVQSFDTSGTLGLVSLAGSVGLDADGFGAPNGYVATDFDSYDEGNGVAIQSDGKIVVAGLAFNGSDSDFAMARYNSDGSPDTFFDNDGKVTTDLSNFDAGQAVAVQSDGKIILAGRVNSGSDEDFAVMRYNPDGSLDTFFDGDGKITTDFWGNSDSVSGIAIQSNGKIVVGGRANNGSNNDFAVARYNSDGSLDTSFDGDGKVTTDFWSNSDSVSGVAIQSDGKIVVGGRANNGSNNDFALARYNSDGSLDTSFDSDGKVTTDFWGNSDSGLDIAIQLDGKIVVVGQTSDGSNYDLALARYNTNGSLDSTFDGDGQVITDLGSPYDSGLGIALSSDGKIIVTGWAYNGSNYDLTLIRYNSNGGLDTSFDDDGKVTTNLGFNDFGNDIAFQADGKIVVAGTIEDASAYSDFIVARYNASGSTFTYDPNGQFDWLATGEIATDTFTYVVSDGLLTDTATVSITITGLNDAPVLAAIGNKSIAQDALLTFTAAASDVDTSDVLTFTLDPGAPSGASINAATGLFTWTPGVGPGVYPLTVRVSDGALDDAETISITVSQAGDTAPPQVLATWPLSQATEVALGAPVVITFSEAINTATFTYTIVPPPGGLSVTWSHSGTVAALSHASFAYETRYTVTVTAADDLAGNPLVAPYSWSFTTLPQTTAPHRIYLPQLMRAFGKSVGLDTGGFGAPNGYVTTDFGYDDEGSSVVIQPDGKIVVAGSADDSNAYSDFAVARYNPDGSLDTSFGGDGKVTTAFSGYDCSVSGAALQSDGKIVVIGVANNGSNADFALVRYNPDGSVDTSFDGDGQVTTDFGLHDWGAGVAIQSDSKIVAVGFAYNGSNMDFALARYSPDGSLDTSFDDDGKVTTDFGHGDHGRSIAIQPDGKIVVAGSADDGNIYDDFAVARYNPDGSLDTSFDGDGKVTTDLLGYDDQGNEVTLQSDGKIVVAGSTDNGSDNDFALARYNLDGSLDTSFDGDGKAVTDFGYRDYGQSVALQSDDKIILAGWTNSGSNADLALARYNPDGSLDTSFDDNGQVITDLGYEDYGNGVAIQSNGKIVVAGTSEGLYSDFIVVRYNVAASIYQR